ncbi:ABC1 kinase family protein [Microtetraspora malaysiensis]|uniref:ABC1 kinase family protein n=1 Tax=Microtetraspora malaysiensis TaxID=161358 RepID=UPI003D91BDB8
MPPHTDAALSPPLALSLSFAIVVMLVLLAVAARRLLGVTFGVFRTAIAAVLAFALTGPMLSPVMAQFQSTETASDPGLGTVWVLVLVAMCIVLIPMVILVVAEALVPSGSVPGPIEVARSLRGRISRARRYSQITRIAFRHGLGPYLRGRGDRLDDRGGRVRLARALRGALDDGGVTFVKLGQVLSTRRDLLPAEFVEELGTLQDRAAPAPWEQVEQVLVAELGGPVDEVFAEFDRSPLASASIAQAYAARLRTGESVVVKVQRPAIRAVVARDLDIVARLARTLEARTRWGRALGLRVLGDGFAAAIREELDFRVEAGNMAAVAASGGGAVTYPSPYTELCTERVLVMERLVGEPLSGAIERGHERGHELARTLLGCLLRQVLVEGVFHADPHPGNIMLLRDGTLGLLDFGSVGRLDASVRAALQRFLVAMNRQDPLGVTDALLEVVPRPEEIDEAALERAMGQFMARHLAPGGASVVMFTNLFKIVTEYGLAVPPEVAAVFRALATLEGTLVALAPGFDLIEEARAFAGRHLAEQLNATSLKDEVTHELATLLPMLRRLPRRVERIASAAEHGRFSMNVRLLADERDRRFLTGVLHQVVLTVLGATAGIMGVVLLGTDGGPQVMPKVVSLYELIGFNLLVISAILALRVLVGVFRRDGL